MRVPQPGEEEHNEVISVLSHFVGTQVVLSLPGFLPGSIPGSVSVSYPVSAVLLSRLVFYSTPFLVAAIVADAVWNEPWIFSSARKTAPALI